MMVGSKRVPGRRGTLYSSNATFREEAGDWEYDLRGRERVKRERKERDREAAEWKM